MEITITIKADKEDLSALQNKEREKNEPTLKQQELLSQTLLKVLGIAEQAK